ncbi:MAG: hypothetical protein AB1782_16330 [Cyanobacteriota bacterium]
MLNKGQNLVEFVIIIAIVVLAGIVVYTFLGDNIHSTYMSSLEKSKSYKPFDFHASNNNDNSITYSIIEGGSLGGKPEAPVKECYNSECTIDYGEFILQGIPTNFGELIETSGTSAGQKELLSLIEQIALQLEQSGDVDGAQQYRDMANLGHFLAEIELKIETAAETCKNNADSFNCMKDKLAEANPGVQLPDNLKNIIPDFNSSECLWWQSLKNRRIGAEQLVNYNNNIYQSGEDISSTNNASVAMFNIFNEIMNNQNYSDNMKAVTTELYDQLSELHTQFDSQVDAYYSMNAFDEVQNYTPEWKILDDKGNVVPQEPIVIKIKDLTDFTNPQYSAGVNLDSVLICATGNNTDSGTVCN